MVGPSPSSTASAPMKSSRPALKAVNWGGVSLAKGEPASAVPARGPGSTALDEGGFHDRWNPPSVRPPRRSASTISRTALAVCVAGASVAATAGADVPGASALSEPPLHPIRQSAEPNTNVSDFMMLFLSQA